MELYVLGGLGLVLLAQALLFRAGRRQQQAVEALDERLGRLTAGVSLLTDTTECGLRDVAQEIGRSIPTASPKRRPNATATRRMRTAARRGRNVTDIAASEEVSEGEVRLRLKLAEATQSEGPHAAVR